MIFNYNKRKSGKFYTFKDLNVGETFMVSDPRKQSDNTLLSVAIDKSHSVYMVIDKNKSVNLCDGDIILDDPRLIVYPVICECSVSLYPDVY